MFNPDYEDFNINSLDRLNYFIKRIETIIRGSKEYKRYLALVYSEFPEELISPEYEDINLMESEIKTEFHHIIHLSDLCYYACQELIEEGSLEWISMYDIVKRVLKYHIDDLIPGVIITTSYHQAIHSGDRELNSDMCGIHLGNYRKFINRFKDLLNNDQLEDYIKIGVSKDEIDELMK